MLINVIDYKNFTYLSLQQRRSSDRNVLINKKIGENNEFSAYNILCAFYAGIAIFKGLLSLKLKLKVKKKHSTLKSNIIQKL